MGDKQLLCLEYPTPFDYANARWWLVKADKHLHVNLVLKCLSFLDQEFVEDMFENQFYRSIFPHHLRSAVQYPQLARLCVHPTTDHELLPEIPSEWVDPRAKTHKCDIFEPAEYKQGRKTKGPDKIIPFRFPFDGVLKPWKPDMIRSVRCSEGPRAAVQACLEALNSEVPGVVERSNIVAFASGRYVPFPIDRPIQLEGMEWRMLHRCLGPKHWSTRNPNITRVEWVGPRITYPHLFDELYTTDKLNAHLTAADCKTLKLHRLNITGCSDCAVRAGLPKIPAFANIKARDLKARAWNDNLESGGAQPNTDEILAQEIEDDLWAMDDAPVDEEFGRFMPDHERDTDSDSDSDSESDSPPAPTRRTRKRRKL